MRLTAMSLAAAVAAFIWAGSTVFAAEQSPGARLAEFVKTFRVTAWANAYCTGFDNPGDHKTVYGMLVNVRAGSPVSPELRIASVTVSPRCPTQTMRIALAAWPKTLPEGTYLVAAQLESDSDPTNDARFDVLGVAGNAPVDAALDDAAYDRAMRK